MSNSTERWRDSYRARAIIFPLSGQLLMRFFSVHKSPVEYDAILRLCWLQEAGIYHRSSSRLFTFRLDFSSSTELGTTVTRLSAILNPVPSTKVHVSMGTFTKVWWFKDIISRFPYLYGNVISLGFFLLLENRKIISTCFWLPTSTLKLCPFLRLEITLCPKPVTRTNKSRLTHEMGGESSTWTEFFFRKSTNTQYFYTVGAQEETACYRRATMSWENLLKLVGDFITCNELIAYSPFRDLR